VTIDSFPAPVARRPSGSPLADVSPVALETYRVRDRVSHDTWGQGRVIDLSEDRSLLITFGGAHTERVLARYRRLQRL